MARTFFVETRFTEHRAKSLSQVISYTTVSRTEPRRCLLVCEISCHDDDVNACIAAIEKWH